MADDDVLYFSYGSNMLKEKIAMRAPSAQLVSIAKLKDYKIRFESHRESGKWHGATCTLDESSGAHAWGAMWRMNATDLQDMDREEGAVGGVSRRLDLEAETPGGETLRGFAYYFTDRNTHERRPSPQYLGLMIKGAEELGIPEYYQKMLKEIEHNGYQGDVEMIKEMEQANKSG